jgi:uncharacterized membrane-anchored protein YjiN (DUF445 family)
LTFPAAREAGSGVPRDDAQSGFKTDRLRRMQWLATSLLASMLVLLAVSAACQSRYPGLHWVQAFAEAGTIGAMADWYAVTALFRRPLGLPIPHTAIIPTHKDRIGATLGEFVEQNFLTPENILAKLRQADAAQALAQWLAARENGVAVASAVADFIPTVLKGLEDREVRHFLDRALTPQLLSLNVSRMAGSILMLLTRDDRHQVLLDRALQALERFLIDKEELIEAKFSEESPLTPRVVDRYVVNKFVQGIIALLHEVVENPRHELRAQFDQAVHKLIQDLANSEEYRRKGQDLLRELVEHLRAEDFYRSLWEEVRGRLAADLQSDSSVIQGYIAAALAALGDRLLDEPGVRRKLNAWWLETVRQIVVRFGHQISTLIADVVQGWDAEEISRKVELEIGKDLQYIRINGTLVGGAVGLLLHAALRAAT